MKSETRVMVWMAALAALFVAAACDMPIEKTPASMAKATAAITYVKDPRTGICFAMLGSTTHSGYEVTSIASVPCVSIPIALLK